MITEPKQVNSGVPQGAFLNRQMVLKGDGMTPFMPQDFRIGLDIGVFGRAIRITDCDEYTRQFFVVSSNFYNHISEPRSMPARSPKLTLRLFPTIKSESCPSP